MPIIIGRLFIILCVVLILLYVMIPCLLLPLLQRIVALFKRKGNADCKPFLWFYSCYINHMQKLYNTNGYKPSYEMRRLLDQMYESITIMATYPMADRQMEQEKGFYSFPWVVLYY